MTATCTLCGQPLTVVTDLRGAKYTFEGFGAMYADHINKSHAAQHKGIIQMLLEVGTAAPGLALFSLLKSDDAQFQEHVAKMRDLVEKACAQKEVSAVITS